MRDARADFQALLDSPEIGELLKRAETLAMPTPSAPGTLRTRIARLKEAGSSLLSESHKARQALEILINEKTAQRREKVAAVLSMGHLVERLMP